MLVGFIESYIGQPLNSTQAQSTIADIVGAMHDTDHILKIVQCSQSLLTSNDATSRAKGALLLQQIIRNCNKSKVSSQSGTVLLEFCLSRLDDKTSLAYHLETIKSLLERNFLSKTDQLPIPSRIFSELNVQSLDQPVRYSVFRIFAIMFEKNTVGLKKLGKVY
jgi:hypothetical protein